MNNDFKILCTGNPNDVGLAQSIRLIFPTAEFISRANGYDFFDPSTEHKFRSRLNAYDVFINYSWVGCGIQEKLLRIVAAEWSTGHVINIGSTNEDSMVLSKSEPEYTNDKLKLRQASLELNNEHFKTTHVVVGGFQATSIGSKLNMDPIKIAKTIKWVLEQDFEIPIIGVQQSSDHIRNWIHQQEKTL
jgi:hypothetical protein